MLLNHQVAVGNVKKNRQYKRRSRTNNPYKIDSDESEIDSFISREYRWSIRGTKVMSEVSGKRFARESFIASLKGKEVIAPICYQGTMDNVIFNF